MCSGFLCCICALISLKSWRIFWYSICEFVQVLFLSLVVNLKFFCSHFPVTAFGLDLFSGAYLNKFTVSVVPDDWELNLSGPSCYLKTGTEQAFETLCFFKKITWIKSKKKRRSCQLTYCVLSFVYTWQFCNAEFGWVPHGPVQCVLVWCFICEIRDDFTYLTWERWRLLITFMRWRGGFNDPMENKPFLSIYE